MTIKEAEEKVIELIYHEPFEPFVVELNHGQVLEVPHPRLAINYDGACFFDRDGILVDFDFAQVHAIRVDSMGAVT